MCIAIALHSAFCNVVVYVHKSSVYYNNQSYFSTIVLNDNGLVGRNRILVLIIGIAEYHILDDFC